MPHQNTAEGGCATSKHSRGRLCYTGVLERDRFVLQELTSRHIPTAVVLSGGYSAQSYQLVANMVAYVLETWGNPDEPAADLSESLDV